MIPAAKGVDRDGELPAEVNGGPLYILVGEDMKFADYLTKEQKQKLVHAPKKKQKKENLTRGDIKELMGINKDTYKRVRGAIRRK